MVYTIGIYTSNNPTNFAHFGDIGIMIAMMKGKCVTNSSSSPHQREYNTIIGNKTRNASKYGDDPCDEIVLQESCQCLPLIKFDRSLLQGDPTTDGTVKLVAYYKVVLQYFDKFFNSESALPTQLDCQSSEFSS